jgi:hypothetical protein
VSAEFERCDVAKVDWEATDSGAPLSLTLPQGAGYYRLRRLSVARKSGASASTYQPVLRDGVTPLPSNRIAGIAAPQPVTSAVYIPNDAQSHTDRWFYAPLGVVYLVLDTDANGDTFEGTLVAERIR